ncbi:hypothetical protein [Loktanella sp. 3ANDIMAR09]|nr:hypothetical protein [Loktanella sp. 3ANDIMAR09]
MECGFSHDTLNAMDEGEFAFCLDARIELDRARKEAADAARE